MIVQKGLHAEALRFISIVVDNTVDVSIDEPILHLKDRPAFQVKVPAPAAYIFHKGLIFKRRRHPEKSAKDLYYMFDILLGYQHMESEIVACFKDLKERYPVWFRQFINNLLNYFEDLGSDGVLWVADQRQETTLPDLDDQQFKQFVFVTFKKITQKLVAIESL